MRQPTFSSILPFLFFLLFSLYLAAPNDDDSTEKFVECLLKKSENPRAISETIYTKNNPLYTEKLNMLVQNLRYETPTTRKPVAVLIPNQESQIQTAIYCSKKTGLQMRIRSGGNDIQGSSYASDVPFFVLDTYGGFRSISIDAREQTAWVGAGATYGELYYALNQSDSSLVFPGSYWPTVGVGGHICSGGSGGLIRKYGVSADNIVDARIINAKGEILDRKSMGKDLFWAIRGGGCASFAVVIAFKLKLAHIPHVFPTAVVTRTLEQDAASLIYKWQHIAPNLPRDLIIAIGLNTDKGFVATFKVSFYGDIKGLMSLMDQHFPELRVTQSDCIMLGWAESIFLRIGLPLQYTTQILLNRTSPAPVPYLQMKSTFVQRPIPKKGIQKIIDLVMQLPPGEGEMEWTPLGGKMEEISESSIPFPHRKGNSILLAVRTAWSHSDSVITEQHLAWARKLYKFIGNFVADNPRRAFVNYRDYDLGTNNINGTTSVEHARSWGAPYFQRNFDRLVQVKTMVDPENYFYHEQSIPLLPSHTLK